MTGRCSYCQLEQVLGRNKTASYTPAPSDGRIFDIIVTPIQDPDWTISKLEVISDMTEIHKSEQKLRITAKAFESQEGMFIADADGVIQYVNKTFIEIAGHSAEETVGQEPSILKSGRHDAEFYQAIRETLEHDDHWQGEVWNRRKSGKIYPEWKTISVARGAEGQVTHYVYIFTDITVCASNLKSRFTPVKPKMTALKARGINFSMDDLGTGYSLLSYLKHLLLYQLNIDQSFVRDVLTDPNDAAIARIIVALAQTMNLAVIAEGVETEAQRAFFDLNGSHTFQGCLFSKPVPVKEFWQLVAQYA